MNVPHRPIIVVLGMLATMPVGGVIWQTLHYLIGLQRLGFDVFYAEDNGIHPAMLADERDLTGARAAAEFIDGTLRRFELGDRWSYHGWNGEDHYLGLNKADLLRTFRNAAAVINLSGATFPRPEHRSGGAFIYLETDPVAPEIELYNGVKATEEFLDAHTAHFTFGENLGAPDCKVPLPPTRYRFHTTRQPIVLDFWEPYGGGPAELFTTIANWRQPERQMTLDGDVYHWSKHREFMKFLDLPQRIQQRFELALSSYEETDRKMLEARGWRVRSALEFSRDPNGYRDYIANSRGEWTVAKDQNIRLRSGWFSDRAATYLAAGRPVVTQETGFSNVLPTGSGLFGFSTMEESVDALEQINGDYERHLRGALDVARKFFSYEVVLPKMLEQAGVPLPKRNG